MATKSKLKIVDVAAEPAVPVVDVVEAMTPAAVDVPREVVVMTRMDELREELEELELEWEELVEVVRNAHRPVPSEQMIGSCIEQLKHFAEEKFAKGQVKVLMREVNANSLDFSSGEIPDLDIDVVSRIISDNDIGTKSARNVDVFGEIYNVVVENEEIADFFSASDLRVLKNWLEIQAALRVTDAASSSRGAPKDASTRGVLWDQITTASGRVIPVSATKDGKWTVRGRGMSDAIKQGKTTAEEVADLIAQLAPPRKA